MQLTVSPHGVVDALSHAKPSSHDRHNGGTL